MTARFASVVRHHAKLLLDAARSDAIAARLDALEPHRAECERADAATARALAADLEDLLVQAGADVRIPAPGQMSLLSLGYSMGCDA